MLHFAALNVALSHPLTPTPYPTGPGTPVPTPNGNDPDGQYAAWSIWPEPHDFVWTSNDSKVTATLPSTFTITCTALSGAACPAPLASAAARYQRTILRFGTPSDAAFLTKLELRAASFTALADHGEYAALMKRTGGNASDKMAWAKWSAAKARTPERWSASHRGGQSCVDASCVEPRSTAAATTTLSSLTVHVNGSGDPPLSIDADESYALTITPTTATLEAKTQWGAIRGLESFAQTVYCLPSAAASALAAQSSGAASCVYSIRNLPLTMNDSPRFKWRGVMIDTARHFIGVPSLKRVIDGMSMNKMNMLHWHATDDQSWSIESTTYPNFTKLGAYSDKQIYSTATIAALHAYAEERGVIIYPEFDVPGHAQIWSQTYPQFTDTSCGGIDPTGEAGHDIFTVLTNLAKEMGGAGPTAIHFGGDEFDPKSWSSCTAVNAWAVAQGAPFVNASGAIDYDIVRMNFQLKIAKAAAALGKRPVFWNEAWMSGLGANSSMPLGAYDKSAIFTSWAGDDAHAIYAGYDVLFNTGWYLDQTNPGGVNQYAWQDYYSNFWAKEPCSCGDPTQASHPWNTPITTAQCEKHVLGGEASLWSERIDVMNIDSQLWPKSSGAAERLWTHVVDTTVKVHASGQGVVQRIVQARIGEMACKMTTRGIAVGPPYTNHATVGGALYAGAGCSLPADYTPLGISSCCQ